MNIDIIATFIAVMTFFGIYALMAISLNLEYGVAGVPNFGQALFVSIGAYVTGVTYTRLLPLLAGEHFINPCGNELGLALQMRSDIIRTMPLAGFTNIAITLVIAAVIGGIVGFVISYMTLRLKQEWYLALVLLVGAEIMRIVVRGMDDLICSHNGISGVSQPFSAVGDPQLASILFMLFVLSLTVIAYIYSERLIRSPYGRMLKALREDENVTQGLGKEISLARAQIMLIGSVIAAVAGVLFAVNVGFVNTNDFVVTLTLDIWVMVVLGGVGNNRGALLGAFFITVLDRATAILAIQMNMSGISLEFNYIRFILFGVILLLMLRYRPQGLLPESRFTTHAHDIIQTERA